jgi:DNA-binding NarL/FixJ family response regulator
VPPLVPGSRLRHDHNVASFGGGGLIVGTSENASCRVAIIDPLPAFRQGMMAVLRAHWFSCEAPDDFLGWIRRPERRAALLGVYDAEGLDLVRRVHHTSPAATIVALLDAQRASQYRSVLRAGATAAVSRAAEPERMVMVLERALHDDCVLPRPIAQALAAEHTVYHNVRLSSEQIAWLHALADGATVSQIAHEAGYSTRQFFRILRHMFDLMGVSNRHEAVARAAEWGILRQRRVDIALHPHDDHMARRVVTPTARTAS